MPNAKATSVAAASHGSSAVGERQKARRIGEIDQGHRKRPYVCVAYRCAQRPQCGVRNVRFRAMAFTITSFPIPVLAAARWRREGADHHAHQRERAQNGERRAERRPARRWRRSRPPRRRSAPGIVNGRTRTASRRPPRRSATVSAAPIRPMKVSAGVPASKVSATAPVAFGSRLSRRPEQRRGDDQRQAGGQPMRERLGGDRELERHARHQDQVERAVLVIDGEQPVEREQARQQRAEPQDRRPDPRQQREVGPDARTAPASPRSGRTARRSRRRRRRARQAGCRAAEGRRAPSRARISAAAAAQAAGETFRDRTHGALPAAAPAPGRARSVHGRRPG